MTSAAGMDDAMDQVIASAGRIVFRMPDDPCARVEARRITTIVLSGWGLDCRGFRDGVLVVVDVLVAHAGPPVHLILDRSRRRGLLPVLRIEVTGGDPSTGAPKCRSQRHAAASGHSVTAAAGPAGIRGTAEGTGGPAVWVEVSVPC